jgi:hypothetical protein
MANNSQWIVVVNQATKIGDITQLSAFGQPMELEEAEVLMADIAGGPDEYEDSENSYDISWVAVVPVYERENFTKILAENGNKEK